MIELKNIEYEIDSLPPFKETVLQAQELLRNPGTSARDLAKVLQYDAGITANILKLCNSAYYGLPIQVTNLQQAIAYIGQTELRNLLMISGSMDYFTGQQSAYEGNYGELWRHSLATAVCARSLGKSVDVKDDALFSAALMHDVGKLILSQYVSEEYNLIRAIVEKSNIPFYLAEQEILGVTHAEVGQMVLEKWNFPANFIEVAEKHHNADLETDPDIVLVVALADLLAGQMGIGTLYDALLYDGFQKLCEYFALGTTEIERVMAKAGTEIQKIVYSYNVNRNQRKGEFDGI